MFENEYYFVEYTLYGMQKNIIFQTMGQCSNWQWALEQLNEHDNIVFEVKAVHKNRY